MQTGIARWRPIAWAAILSLGLNGLGSAYAADLAQVYELSRKSDPKYNAARYEFEAAAYAEPQALAALLPSASFEMTNQSTNQNILGSRNAVFATGRTQFPTYNETLTLTQPVFKLSAWRGYQQAKTKVKQAAATFSAAEQDLILRTAAAYINVLAARDALGFAEAEREAIKRQLDLVEQRFKSGVVAIASLHDAKARFEIKSADVVGARIERDDRLQALRELTGSLPGELKSLRDVIPLDPPTPDDIGHWVEAAEKQNLLLEARRLAVEVAQAEVGRLRAGHAPVLDVVVTHGRKDTGGSLFGGGSDVQNTDVMLRLNVPLYSGGLVSAVTGEAAKRYQGALEDLERDLRQTERQARAAFQGVTGGAVRVRALAQGVTSSESARELKLAGFKSGIETLLQVLDAERDLYAAKRDSAKARYELLLNRLRLKQSIGTLSEADLAQINVLLQ